MAAWILFVALMAYSLPEALLGQAQWTVDRSPDLIIGSADGLEPPVFQDIRSVVLASGDSLIVVADGGESRIRVFTTSGIERASFGRSGEGPGEFRSLRWVGTCGGEELVAYDGIAHRASRLSITGDLISVFQIESAGTLPPYTVTCGPTGEFVVVGWPEITEYNGSVGPYRPTVTVSTAGPDGTFQRTIGVFPGPERYRFTNSDGPRPFGRSATARIGRRYVYVGTADSYMVERIDALGNRDSVGDGRPPLALTSHMKSIWQDSVLASIPDRGRPAFRRLFETLEFPEQLPAYADFLLDRQECLWLARYPVPGEPVQEWDVFDAGGEYAATISLPGDFRPSDIGEGFILGISTDSLGVQRVHRYRLSRPH